MNEEPTVSGNNARIYRLDEEGNPVGEPISLSLSGPIKWLGEQSGRIVSEEGNVEEIERPVLEFKEMTMDVEFTGIEVELLSLIEPWLLNRIYAAMGAEYQFDYSGLLTPYEERLTNCYEYAALAFDETYFTHAGVDKADVMEHHDVPPPATLVHGHWSSPETRDKPIAHAWVVLADGRIWEPISSLIYSAEKFYAYTEPHDLTTYGETEVHVNLMRFWHYGPWS
jgi:hypothetical protein